MNPVIASVLAMLLVVLGGATVFTMLEMTGKVGDHAAKTVWVFAHKVLGYLFFSIFVIMSILMIRKVAGFQEELTVRAMLHIVMALILAPLVVVKVLLARRYCHLSSKLPLLGITIFTLSFGLTGITAGYYVLHRSNLTYTTLSVIDNDLLDMELGRVVMNKKCSKCHSLERVYLSYKSDNSWVKTINKMARLDSPNISSFDVKQILNYLVEQQKKRPTKSADSVADGVGKPLVSLKCSICHSLDRVFVAKKDEKEWTITVSRMITNMGTPSFLSEQEKSDIITYLSARNK